MVQENNSFLLLPHRKLPFLLLFLIFPYFVRGFLDWQISCENCTNCTFLFPFEASRFTSSIDIFLLAKIFQNNSFLLFLNKKIAPSFNDLFTFPFPFSSCFTYFTITNSIRIFHKSMATRRERNSQNSILSTTKSPSIRISLKQIDRHSNWPTL